jgi:predicted transcriptional regulator
MNPNKPVRDDKRRNIYISDDQWAHMEQVACEKRMSRAAAIRQAIDEYLKRNSKTAKGA